MSKAFMHRSANDNRFPTHTSMTEQFLDLEKFNYSLPVREPACGDGFMSSVLEKRFKKVYPTDLQWGCNFYTNPIKPVPYIITNPPYGEEADKFVIRAKDVCTKKFAFLLRTNYLSGQGRYIGDIYKWLRRVYIFTRMSDLGAPLRPDGKYPTAGIVYAWLVWEIGYNGKPEVEWINNQPYVLKASEAI